MSVLKYILRRWFDFADYTVDIMYVYSSDGPDYIKTSNVVFANSRASAVRQALHLDEKDKYGPEYGWRELRIDSVKRI